MCYYKKLGRPSYELGRLLYELGGSNPSRLSATLTTACNTDMCICLYMSVGVCRHVCERLCINMRKCACSVLVRVCECVCVCGCVSVCYVCVRVCRCGLQKK